LPLAVSIFRINSRIIIFAVASEEPMGHGRHFAQQQFGSLKVSRWVISVDFAVSDVS
jgi:hypothetical protein